MADLMTQAFEALQKGRGQTRLTGNQALMTGANQDQPLYEGYFDAMMKNRRADRAQALEEKRLDVSTALRLQDQALRLQDQALNQKMVKQSNTLGWASLGAQALGYGLKAFEPAITQGVQNLLTPAQTQAPPESFMQAIGGQEAPGFLYDQYKFELINFDNVIEMDLGDFFNTWFEAPTLDWGSFIA